MAIHVGYEPARGDSGGAAPGARALMAWYLGTYGHHTAPRPANLGIYNPKRLGSGWSLHAEGRAGDLGTSPYSRPSWGWALADQLRLHSAELGIQLVIFDGKVWSGSYPHNGWRNYSGSEPHTGHLHVELTKAAAKALTVERINQVIGGDDVKRIDLAHGERNSLVTFLQRCLEELGTRVGGEAIKVDGDYGDKTAAHIRVAELRWSPKFTGDGKRVTAETWMRIERMLHEQRLDARLKQLPLAAPVVDYARLASTVDLAQLAARIDTTRLVADLNYRQMVVELLDALPARASAK